MTPEDRKTIIEALKKSYRWLEQVYPESIWPGRGANEMADGLEARDARESCKEALALLRAEPEAREPVPANERITND